MRRGWGMSMLFALVACPRVPMTPPSEPQETRVLVITPLDFELEAVSDALDHRDERVLGERQSIEGNVGSLHIDVLRSGWGKAHAAGATALGIERFHPTLVMLAGVGGGLSDQVASGDTVVAAASFQHDLGTAHADGGFERFVPESPTEQPWPLIAPTDARWSEAIAAAVAPQLSGAWCETDAGVSTVFDAGCGGLRIGRDVPRTCLGLVATGDVFVEDPLLAIELSDAGAVLADMETAAVAQEARNARVPFVALRVVADTASDDGYARYQQLKPVARQRLTLAVRAALERIATEKPPVEPFQERCEAH